jgi:hypothetical protein
MKILIGEDELEYIRPHLKKWLILQDRQTEVVKAVDNRNNVAKQIISYVSTALDIPEDRLNDCPWYEIGSSYLIILHSNSPQFDFPLLNAKIKDKDEVWDYPERTFFVWAHLFAKEYGWNIEYIAELDVDTAIALMQEIAISDQLDKEWEWMCSEIAYQGKDGFKELPRPDWMKYSRAKMVIPKLKIRKELAPSGIILRYEASESGERP